MAEYIEKEALIKALEADFSTDWADYASKNNFDKDYIDGARDEYDDVLKIICQQPAADVQPVIHAHWIELPKAMNPNENPCKCSNCGHVVSFMNHYPKSNYCPNCGAKMRGEDDA